jgi:hypothetical protein
MGASLLKYTSASLSNIASQEAIIGVKVALRDVELHCTVFLLLSQSGSIG